MRKLISLSSESLGLLKYVMRSGVVYIPKGDYVRQIHELMGDLESRDLITVEEEEGGYTVIPATTALIFSKGEIYAEASTD